MKKEEAFYRNGALDGIYSNWASTGEIQQQRTYKSNQLHGPNVSWWVNNSMNDSNNGMIPETNGPFGSPYQNHLKKEESTYVNGQLDGIS